MMSAEQQNEANLRRLTQLFADAQEMEHKVANPLDAAHWRGVAFGLQRAVSVLKGNG